MVFEENNQKRCCMKVETGTMIFAVINAAMWCLGTCAALFSLIAINVYAAMNLYNRRDIDVNLYTFIMNIFLCICLLVSAINFIFAVFLCNGVSKKIPSHIKAYFIFGVVQVALLSFLDASLIALSLLNQIALAVFISIILYCLVLWMVYLTQVKFTKIDYHSFKHKRLVNTVY